MAITAQYHLTTDLKDSISGNYLDVNKVSENQLIFSHYGTYGFKTDLYPTTFDSPFEQLTGDFTVDVTIEFSKDQYDTCPLERQCIFRSSYSDPSYEGWQNDVTLDFDLSLVNKNTINFQANGSTLIKSISLLADRPNLITLIKKDDEIFLFVDGIMGSDISDNEIKSINVMDLIPNPISVFQIGYTDDPQDTEPLLPNCVPFAGKIKEILFQNEAVIDIDITDPTMSIGGNILFNPFVIEQHSNGAFGLVYPRIDGVNYTILSNVTSGSSSFSESTYYSITGENPFSQIGENDFSVNVVCTIEIGLDTQSIISYGYNGCENFCIKAITVQNPDSPSGSDVSLYFSGGITVSLAPELIGTPITINYGRKNGVITIAIENESKFAFGELVNTTNYGKFGTLSYGQSYDPTITGDESFSGSIALVKFLSIYSLTGDAEWCDTGRTRSDKRYCNGGGDQLTINLVKGYYDGNLADISGFKNDLKAVNGVGLTPISLSGGILNLGTEKLETDNPSYQSSYTGDSNPRYSNRNVSNYVTFKDLRHSSISNVINKDFVLNLKINFGTKRKEDYTVDYKYSNVDFTSATVVNALGGILAHILSDDGYPSIRLNIDNYVMNHRFKKNVDGSYTLLNLPQVYATNLRVGIDFLDTSSFELISSIDDCFDGQDHDITLILQNKELVLLIDGIEVPPQKVTATNGFEFLSAITPGIQYPNFGGAFLQPIEITVTNDTMQNRHSIDKDITGYRFGLFTQIRIGGKEEDTAGIYHPTLFNTVVKGIRIVQSLDDITDWSYFDSPELESNVITLEYCDTQSIPNGTTVIGGAGNSTDTEQPGDRPNEQGGGTPPIVIVDFPPQVCVAYICPGDDLPIIDLGPNEKICVKPYCPPQDPHNKEIPVKLAQTTLGKKLFLELDAAPTSGSGYDAAIGSVALVEVGGVGKQYTKTGSSATAWTEGAGGTSGATQQYVDSADNALSARITTNSGNITTLNGQISTANSQISTINGEISTINGQISTLQSNASSYATTTYVDNNTAKKDLSNLTTTALAIDLQPATNEGTNLGTSGARFNAIRAKNAYLAEIKDASDVPVLDITTRQIKNSSGVVLMDFNNGTISFNNKKLTSVADPTSDQDVSTKKYVDNNTATARVVDASAANTTTLTTTDQRYMDVQNGTLGTNHTILLPSNATLPVGTKFQITNSSNTLIIVQNSSGSTITNIPKGFTGLFPSRNTTESWFASVSQNSGSVFSSVGLTANTTTIDLVQGNQFYVENSTSGAVSFTLSSTGPSGIVNGQRVTIIIKNTHASSTMTPTVNGITCPAVNAGAAISLTFMKINGTIYKVSQQNPAS
jgi:hypothetical protein